MRKANLGLANRGIERILELSADAHIQRRGTVKDSPEFHHLTGAIAAYGNRYRGKCHGFGLSK